MLHLLCTDLSSLSLTSSPPLPSFASAPHLAMIALSAQTLNQTLPDWWEGWTLREMECDSLTGQSATVIAIGSERGEQV